MKHFNFLFLLPALALLFPVSGFGAGKERPLYPDIFQCWKKAPLVKENFSNPEGKYYASAKDITFYKRLLRELKSPHLRAILIRELAQLENPDLGQVFLPQFLNDPAFSCRREALNTLEKWSKKGVKIPRFSEKNLQEFLACNDPAAKSSLFSLALTEKWPLPLSRYLAAIDWKRDVEAVGILSGRRRELKGDKRKEGERLLQRKEMEARLFGLALLWDAVSSPDTEQIFRERLSGKNALIYKLLFARLAASSPKKAPRLLALLGQEEYFPVRLVIAENMIPHTGEKEGLLCRYLAGNEPLSLRTASAGALGKGKTATSLSLLIRTLKEKDPVLRRTARLALTERKPSAPFRRRIADECRKDPNAYKEAAAFFAALPDRNIAGPFFARLLQEKKHPEVMILDALKGMEAIGNTAYAPIAAAYASSPSPAVREACAKALGKMKNPKAYPALKHLMRDRNAAVAEKAFVSAWQWGESLPFIQEIRRTLRTRNDTGSFVRLGAIRCAARLPEAQFKHLFRDLETLMLKECIVIPMMPRSYDLEEVRLSVLLLLGERKEAAAKRLFRQGIAQLEKEVNDPEKGQGKDSPMYEFIRQIREQKAGRKVIPAPVPDRKGIFTINPLG